MDSIREAPMTFGDSVPQDIIRYEPMEEVPMTEETASSPTGAAETHRPVRKASDYVDDIAVEIATYKARLPELLTREGEYVLIKGDQVIGFFKTSRAAVRGLPPFRRRPASREEDRGDGAVIYIRTWCFDLDAASGRVCSAATVRSSDVGIWIAAEVAESWSAAGSIISEPFVIPGLVDTGARVTARSASIVAWLGIPSIGVIEASSSLLGGEARSVPIFPLRMTFGPLGEGPAPKWRAIQCCWRWRSSRPERRYSSPGTCSQAAGSLMMAGSPGF